MVIRGIEYPTLGAAAAALGVSKVAICKARKAGRLDTVGLNPSMSEPIPVKIRGKKYPSMYAAAKALGMSPTTVWSAAGRGTLDNVGARKK
jgi:hypothetical protein